jgi:hypothetical protein
MTRCTCNRFLLTWISVAQLTRSVIGIIVLATNVDATALPLGLYWWALGDTIVALLTIVCVSVHLWLEKHSSILESMPLTEQICNPFPDLSDSFIGWLWIGVFFWGVCIWPTQATSVPYQQQFPGLWLYFTVVLWIGFAQMAAATVVGFVLFCYDCLCDPPDDDHFLNTFPTAGTVAVVVQAK